MGNKVRMAGIFILLSLSLFISGCAVQGDSEGLITVSPESAVVKFGDTKQFSAAPAGTAVTWSVNGLDGGDSSIGTIDTNGLYAAPLGPAESTENVTLRATDAAGSAGSAKVFLTNFKANERLTQYTAGVFRANTYSAGQRSIATYKDINSGIVSVYAVWVDDSLGVSQVWFTKSSNNGDDFCDPVRVDEIGFLADQFSPSIAVDSSGNVYVAWEGEEDGDADIYVARFEGIDCPWTASPFTSPVKVNQSRDVGTLSRESSPAIEVDPNGVIYVTWEDRFEGSENYPDIYFATSNNLGLTFPTNTFIANAGRRPSIAIDSLGTAYVVWEDLTEYPSLSPTHIKIRKIVSGVVTGTPTQIDSPLSPFDHARFPAVAVGPAGRVYVVWQRALILDPKFSGEIISTYDMDLAKVDGLTLTVESTTLSFPNDPNVGVYGGPSYPTIAGDSSNIYVAWDDQRNGTKDIYFAKSSNGAIFTTNRIVNDSTGTWHEKPSIAVSEGKAFVIWTDYRNTSTVTTISPNDVFFAREE